MTADSESNSRIHDVIARRWSPRAFDASQIPQDDLDLIFEAAGRAPSAFNLQPWTFLYARRDDANWERFQSLLMDFNRSWAKEASALVFVISDRLRRGGAADPVPNHSHSFDAGAAWALAALQATAMGYWVHGMTGLNFDKARAELGIPEDHRLEMAFVIGRKGPSEQLPEALQAREAPSSRKPVSEIARAGSLR